ncbi:MAG: DNA primase [Gemmatimonadaceae bacterium]
MIPDDIVERVREQADIVSIVGELVKLKRVGNSFRGPCPFHQGKDPNFAVSPRGGYICFVCHEKGDVFNFVQKRLGLDFVDAVKYVGAKAGVDVKEVSRERTAGPDPREKFWEINAAAAEYFTRTLWDGDLGAPAREYLAKRDLDRATADRFGIGFAPREGGLLREHLNTLGFDDARQIESGLLHVKSEGEEPRPRFRNRLMFPISDPQGRVIAFGGRVIGLGEPKYLNSAESPVFVKGGTLYGLHWAKNAIRRDERALLVEGYFDCVRLMAAGIESTVAPLGTALTEPQAELLRKYTSTVFLLYDSDQAGLTATFRAGDVLLRQGFKVHVVTLPDGEDPDTFVNRYGREKLETHLAAAIDVFERKLQILQRGGWFSDLRRKRVALDRLLPTIRAAADPITYGLYVARAAEVAGISEEVLQRELRAPRAKEQRAATPQRDTATPPAAQAVLPHNSGASAERELVRVILHFRQLIDLAAEQVDARSLRDARLRAIFGQMLGSAAGDDVNSIAGQLPEHAVDLFQQLLLEPHANDPQRVFEDCISKLKRREIGEKLDDIERDLPLTAGIEKDELLMRQTKLNSDLRALGGNRWKKFRTTRPS